MSRFEQRTVGRRSLFVALVLVSGLGLMDCARGGSDPPSDERHEESAEGSGATEEQAVVEGSGSAGEAGPEAAVVSDEVEPPVEARLWIGLRCDLGPEGSEMPRRFSFYIDGAPIQSIDTRCVSPSTAPKSPPNGGQFTVRVPVGVRVLRVQDDDADHHVEEEIGVPGDAWVTVSHRAVGGAGFMTTVATSLFEPIYDRAAESP